MTSLQTANQSIPPPPVAAAPDARTQEMINEKLKKAEELGLIFFNHAPYIFLP